MCASLPSRTSAGCFSRPRHRPEHGLGRTWRPPPIVPVTELQLNASGAVQLRETAHPTPLPDDDSYLLLERDLLDQQIIDVNGHKVVRVNDVDSPGRSASHKAMNIALDSPSASAEVEVGMRGAVRRLLKGFPREPLDTSPTASAQVVIPWDFVDLIHRPRPTRPPQDRPCSSLEDAPLRHRGHPRRTRPRRAPGPLRVSSTRRSPPRPSKRSSPRCSSPSSSPSTPKKIAAIVEEMDPVPPPTSSPNLPTNARR